MSTSTTTHTISGIPSSVYFNNAYKKYYHTSGGKQKKILAYYKKKWGDKIGLELFNEDIDLNEKVQKIKNAISIYKKNRYLKEYNMQTIST